MKQKANNRVQTQPATQTNGADNDAMGAAEGAAEKAFATLFAASSDALVICRQADACILEVNESFVRLSGYSQAEILGRRLDDANLYLHPQDGKRIRGALQANGAGGSLALEMRTKGGMVRQITWTVETIVSQGQPCWLFILRSGNTHTQPADGLDLSEERTRVLVETIPAAMFMCDNEGLINFYNQRAAELWGRNPKLLDPVDRFSGAFRIYRPDGALLPHDECPMAVTVHTGRRIRNEEILIEQPGGAIILASVNVDPLYDQAGRLIGAINVFEDITQRKQAEARLQAIYQLSEAVSRAEAVEQIYEQAFTALAQVLHVERAAILLLDEEGVMRFQAWSGLSAGYRQGVEGHSPWSIDDEQPQPVLIPNVTEADLGPLLPVVLKEEIGALAFIPLVESGRLLGKFMLYYDQPHLFAEAEVQWAQSVARKVAYALQRKQAEDALRASEANYRALFESASDGIFIASDERIYVEANASACRLSGYTRQELLGKTLRDLTPPADWPRLDDDRKVLLAGDSQISEWTLLRKDGAIVPIEVSAKQLPDGRWQAFVRDISERKQTEATLRQLNATLEQRVAERTAELERSNRELDQFAYIASHDLRSPLRAINNLAAWIGEDAAEALPAASQVHLAKLRTRIKRMDALLNDLLDYSRAGRHHHSPERIDTGELVRSLLDLLALPPLFAVNIAYPMPIMVAERVPLETVFRNLIGNAIKHHHGVAGGHVSVSAQDHGHFVQFTVADNGPGIDPAYHQRIFEIFQTLQPRDQVEGSGIGLSVVKRLVESRGGTIDIESAPGQGAAFRFTWSKG